MNSTPNRLRTLLLGAAIAAAGLAAPLAHAQTPAPATGPAQAHAWAGHHGHHRGHMMVGMMKKAGVSDQQMASIRAIYKGAHEDLRAQGKTTQLLRQQMAQALSAPQVNAAAAQTLQAQINAQRDTASARMLQAKLQVAAVLTPEQRQSIRTQMDERRAKWQARHAEKSA